VEKKKKVEMPAEVSENKELKKYWWQRYRLFARFDEGIRLDHGGSSHLQNTGYVSLLIYCVQFSHNIK